MSKRRAASAVFALSAGCLLSLPLADTAQAVPVADSGFFLQDVDGDGFKGLYRRTMPAGAATAVVADDTIAATIDISDLSVSRDGSRIVYVLDTYTADRDPIRQKVVVRDVSGREVRVVSDVPLPGTTATLQPALSPDGRIVVWTARNRTTGATSVRRDYAAYAAAATVVNGYGGGAFLNDTTLLVQNPAGSAFTVPLAGGTPSAASGFPAGMTDLTLSPDGAHAAWSLPLSDTAASVQTATLTGTVASDVTTLATAGVNTNPSFSNTGLTAYFIHEGDIWTAPTDGSTSAATTGATYIRDFDVAVGWKDDGTAPGGVTPKPFLLGASTVKLGWTLPADTGDLSGVVVTRRRGSTAERVFYIPAPATTLVDSGLPTGSTYAYEFLAVDRSGNTSPIAVRSAVPMTPAISYLDPITITSTTSSFTVIFASTSTPTTATFYAQYQMNGSATWQTWVNGATGRARTFGAPASTNVAATTGIPGRSYSFRVLIKDAAGNATAQVTKGRAVVPFDQTKASFVGGVTQASPAAYLGSWRRLTSTSHSASVTVTGNRLQVVGTKCQRCGYFDIFDGSKYIGSVNTFRTSEGHRMVLFSYAFSGTRTFTIRVKGGIHGNDVILDGFAVRS